MRTIVFGLDGYDFEFATELARQGRLPWLSAQLERGSRISTHCPALPGSEWTNAACGVSAGHHGFLHTSQLRLGTYEIVETDATVVRTDPFYVPLANAGIETIVIDLPVDHPRPAAHLTQVIDWGTEFKLFRYCTTPKQTREFVQRSCGNHPFTDYGGTIPDEPALIALNDKIRRGVALKGELIRAFMRANPDWSVIFAGFGEVHKAGHFFWNYRDPTHPDYAGAGHPLASALEEIYLNVDRALASVCAEAGDGANVIFVTDRGMRANYRGDHLMNALLGKWQLNCAATSRPVDDFRNVEELRSATQAAEPVLRRIKRRVPVALRPWLRRLGGFDRDWGQIRVFPVPDVGNSYLRVNLRGREPRGTVGPGAEYARLLEKLTDELLALINPATGTRAVEQVVFPQRDFPGPLNETLPDLGVIWAADAPITALESPSIGRLEGAHWEPRPGNHTTVGAMLVSGPAFTSGGSRAGDLRELAPTLLALHGVPIPPHYERAPMPELRSALHAQ